VLTGIDAVGRALRGRGSCDVLAGGKAPGLPQSGGDGDAAVAKLGEPTIAGPDDTSALAWTFSSR